MSYINKNYIYSSNNIKGLNQIQQSNFQSNLFKRNNKFYNNFQNQTSNKTANNFSYNFMDQKQLLNSKDRIPIYNTYYSNFQSQQNHIPYKINISSYNNSIDYRRLNSGDLSNNNISNNNINDIFTRYNPILNQISQNSIGIINSSSSYPLQYN